MVVANQIKEKISTIPEGVVFTISDFGFDAKEEIALAKALSRMVLSGTISKVSKGKYYKPKQTLLGVIKPAATEIVKDFLERDGQLIGYMSGPSAFASMGLTSQISSSIVIGSNKYRRPLIRGEWRISFLKQENRITEENVPLLRILDAIKMIREIPATTPDSAIATLISIINSLPEEKCAELEQLSLGYTSYVRALLGAILERIGRPTAVVRRSINGLSSFKLPISDSVLPNKSNWNIDEPTRK